LGLSFFEEKFEGLKSKEKKIKKTPKRVKIRKTAFKGEGGWILEKRLFLKK
jgi:hypothetical protein